MRLNRSVYLDGLQPFMMPTFSPLLAPIKQKILAQWCDFINEAIYILDANLCYLSVNNAYVQMIGYSEAFLIGRPLGIYPAEYLPAKERAILKNIANCLEHDGFYENDFLMATHDGRTLDCHMSYRKICIEQTTYHVGMVRDVSAVVKDKEQLTHMLNHNQLTGLPNRKVFLNQASMLLKHDYQKVLIVRVTIDRYRDLTNILGQDSANTLLKNVVTRVQQLPLAHLHCFSHFGADDFALLFACDDKKAACQQLKHLMHMCEQPFILPTAPIENTTQHSSSLNDNTLYLHLSVGVSHFSKLNTPLTELLMQAEKALQYVKQHGGDDCCWYNLAVNQAILQDISINSLQLETELRSAINNHEFIVYYQPKVVLETAAIVGFEVLVRWQHPTRGLLSPIDFMEVILKHKLSFELFRLVVAQVAKQLVLWKKLGISQRICINADAAEFNHPDFINVINSLFEQQLIEPYQLHIELTESSLMLNHDNVKQQLYALKALGVCLILDDFGTGYASLSYLQEYDFDTIKIDKIFITNIHNDRTQQAIVKAILDLANALDMQVVAEGVETKNQRDLLLKMGCQYAQGYWFGRPVSGDKATNLLTQQTLSE